MTAAEKSAREREQGMRIDFHAHILPEMDHGCASVEEAMGQLQLAAAAGVDCVVATSHFYPQCETVENFVDRRRRAAEKLFCGPRSDSPRSISPQAIWPRVILGAEVLLCAGMERMEGLEQLCVENTGVLLLEMPFSAWEDSILETLSALQHRRDLKLVLAHIERYTPENLARLSGEPCRVQVNGSFCRSFRKRRIVGEFARQGRVVALGSDIHGAGKTAYRDFQRAQRQLERMGFSMGITERLLGWQG